MLFLIGVCATFIGSMTGLGGGIIIKPLLSLFTSVSVVDANFLSASAVLVMALFNSVKSYRSKSLRYFKGLEWLIVGAMFGGVVGASFFKFLVASLSDDIVASVQAWLLLFTLGLLYFLNSRRSFFSVGTGGLMMFVCGFVMSLVSSFLGIGGGPVNMYVFVKVLGFDPKSSVVLSLVTILFCQIASLVTMLDGVVFSASFVGSLVVICVAGITGAVVGSRVFVYISEVMVTRLFDGALLFVALVNVLIIFR